jgi:hypothetical protein
LLFGRQLEQGFRVDDFRLPPEAIRRLPGAGSGEPPSLLQRRLELPGPEVQSGDGQLRETPPDDGARWFVSRPFSWLA